MWSLILKVLAELVSTEDLWFIAKIELSVLQDITRSSKHAIVSDRFNYYSEEIQKA